PVGLGLGDRRVEVDVVPLGVLGLLEGDVGGRTLPRRDEAGAQAGVRLAAVDRAQRRKVGGQRVARHLGRVGGHDLEHVTGARTEADDAPGVAPAIADVFDVAVLGTPVQRRVLGAGHQLHGDVLALRVVEVDPGDHGRRLLDDGRWLLALVHGCRMRRLLLVHGGIRGTRGQQGQGRAEHSYSDRLTQYHHAGSDRHAYGGT